MKKKILIVSSSLVTGGLEKCLITLCDNLDYTKYDVDLYLFNEGRQLLPQLNPNVHLLPDSPFYALMYNRSVLKSCMSLLRAGRLDLCLHRISRFIRGQLGKRLNTVKDWDYMKRTMLRLDTHYDVAIGFEECSAGYYVAQCVDADVKSCWIHTDIKAIDTDPKMDRMAFERVDYICTVSDNSRNSLLERYPEFADKYRVFTMPALQDTSAMFEKAQASCVLPHNGIKLLSVGRLVELKGFHLCVCVLEKLVKEGYDARWYIAGEGDYRQAIEEQIERCNMQDRFILLGNCENPYAYMQQADICVQPSSYEGLPVTVWEEKMLRKAVVVSDIPAHKELITHGVNGLIVVRDSQHIYEAVKKLLDDDSLLHRLANAPLNREMSRQETVAAIEATFEKSTIN